MRTAMVAGTAAAVGHHAATRKAQEQSQNQQIEELQQQQYAQQPQAAPPPAAAPGAMSDEKFEELNQLKQLLDSGVLSQAEFDAQKAKILNS